MSAHGVLTTFKAAGISSPRPVGLCSSSLTAGLTWEYGSRAMGERCHEPRR